MHLQGAPHKRLVLTSDICQAKPFWSLHAADAVARLLGPLYEGQDGLVGARAREHGNGRFIVAFTFCQGYDQYLAEDAVYTYATE